MPTRYFLFLLAVVLYVIGCSGESLPSTGHCADAGLTSMSWRIQHV